MLLVVQAVREGWGCDRLAKEAGICTTTAADVLATVSKSIVDKAHGELGVMAAEMRKEATKERPAVVRRLRAAGELADTLLAKAKELIEALDPEDDALADEEEEAERLEEQAHGGALRRRQRAITLEERLASLSASVKAATAAAKDSWAAFKDASGLAFAEDAARAAVKAGSKVKLPMVTGTVVELDSSGGRDDGES
jgi:hypothetical protein